MEEKKVLLSVRNLNVKFRVRGRVLTAIRNVSLDIFENETIAIVGESGCGKSVFTKTFAGMLDNNGFIDQGDIIFFDDSLTDEHAPLTPVSRQFIAREARKLNQYAQRELGAPIYRQMLALQQERKEKMGLSPQEEAQFAARRRELRFEHSETNNLKLTLDANKDREAYKAASQKLEALEKQLKALEQEQKDLAARNRRATRQDTAYNRDYAARMAELKAAYAKACAGQVTQQTRVRNERLAREVYLSVARYPARRQPKLTCQLNKALRTAMQLGVDLSNETELNHVFETAVFRVKYLEESEDQLHGVSYLNLAKTHCVVDWTHIRGNKIATIFQDPMTSLNPILTIGHQITSVIIKHQHVSETEARKRAIILMKKVGIPNAENRFDDYPFQYSGGMRQRIVIAIALSCQPKILICDEPTTALDVTIQAQILQLIKDLQKEFGYTIVFITHDLGVVANVADRVAVLYAGQIVEVGTVEEVFYDPRHPYTWVLLSSLPQLSERDTELFSIAGTPPSLYNKIHGDAFAPRNPYCLKVDTLREPPMFQVSETHFAKTWLLDPRAPKVEKPAIIRDVHGTLKKVFNI